MLINVFMHMVLFSVLVFGGRVCFILAFICFSSLGVIAMLLLVYVLDPDPDLHNP